MLDEKAVKYFASLGFTTEDISNIQLTPSGDGKSFRVYGPYYTQNRTRLYGLINNMLKSLERAGRKATYQQGEYYIPPGLASMQPKPVAQMDLFALGYQKAKEEEAAKRSEMAKKASNARWTRAQEKKAMAANPDLN